MMWMCSRDADEVKMNTIWWEEKDSKLSYEDTVIRWRLFMFYDFPVSDRKSGLYMIYRALRELQFVNMVLIMEPDQSW